MALVDKFINASTAEYIVGLRLAEAEAAHKEAVQRITTCRNDLRKELRSVVAMESHMNVYVRGRNTWAEWFVSSHDDVIAYVSLTRQGYQWNRDVAPATPLLTTPDEWKTIQAVEDKLVELGLIIDKYDVVNTGNEICYRVVLPS